MSMSDPRELEWAKKPDALKEGWKTRVGTHMYTEFPLQKGAQNSLLFLPLSHLQVLLLPQSNLSLFLLLLHLLPSLLLFQPHFLVREASGLHYFLVQLPLPGPSVNLGLGHIHCHDANANNDVLDFLRGI